MNRRLYDPNEIIKKNKDKMDVGPYNIVQQTDEELHIGQSYDDENAKVIRCIECGSTDFKVATGSYYTAIKCKKCEYELCIHDG